MRRLPIYFLIDVSESMVGEPIKNVQLGMKEIIQELRTDPYALESAYISIIAFAGSKIRDDMKSKLIMSGYGIELVYEEDSNGERILEDPKNLFKQRCYIELGLNWFPHASGQKIPEQLSKLGY